MHLSFEMVENVLAYSFMVMLGVMVMTAFAVVTMPS